MTGELKPVKKNEDNPFLLSGCQVAEGYGKMIITAVGMLY
jgi:Ca2+-transporting ATPase